MKHDYKPDPKYPFIMICKCGYVKRAEYEVQPLPDNTKGNP